MTQALVPGATGLLGGPTVGPCSAPQVGTAGRPLYEAAFTALSGLVVAAFCGVLLWHDPGFYWHDDYQSYQLAGFCEIARCWREGEFPLLSSCSWNGGALAGEYQYGVFSPFLTGCVLIVFGLGLPLPLAAAALSITHLAVLAAGAFRLSRRRGLAVDLALLVALAASLNGWVMIWGAKNWFSCLAGFAWLPWLWSALHGALEKPGGPSRFLSAGFFLYLIVTAGWPLTVVTAGVLSLWFVARTRVEQGRWRAAWPVAAAWGLGLGLSAPAWLMLLEFAGHAVRGQGAGLLLDPCWVVPLSSLPGLVLPALVTPWNVFGTVKLHRCAELAGGLALLAILLAALCHHGRDFLRRFRWEGALCLLALALAVIPGIGSLRWSFRWLPFFFLVLAVLAAHALAELRARVVPTDADEPRPNPGLWATLLVVPAWLYASALGTDPTAQTMWQGAAFTLIALLWAALEWRSAPGSAARNWAAVAVVLATAALTFAPVDRSLEVPAWDLNDVARQTPLDPGVTYLSVCTKSDVITPDTSRPLLSARGVGQGLLHGNVGMYAGSRLINGYSPLRPRGLAEVIGFASHGFLGSDSALHDPAPADAAGLRIGRWLLTREAGPGGLLEQMGVDGLIVADRFALETAALEASGWRPVAIVAGGRVFHREGAASPSVRAVERVTLTGERAAVVNLLREREDSSCPWVLLDRDERIGLESLTFAPARVDPQAASRTSVVVDVTNLSPERESLVVFARPWYPGYRAELNGTEVPVELVNLILPAVRLPAGAAGRLTLIYRPNTLIVGCWIAAAACTAALLIAVASVFWHPRREARR